MNARPSNSSGRFGRFTEVKTASSDRVDSPKCIAEELSVRSSNHGDSEQHCIIDIGRDGMRNWKEEAIPVHDDGDEELQVLKRITH